MRPGFHGTPIVRRCQDNGIHTVHNALVVGCRPVWIGCRKRPGCNYSIAHLFRRKFIERQLRQRNGAGSTRQAAVCQVGQDAQVHPPATDLLHRGGQPFRSGIDGIGTHGVPYIINEVKNQEGTHRGFLDQAHFQVHRTAAQPGKHGVHPGNLCQQGILLRQQTQARGCRVGQFHNLHLPNHVRLIRTGSEAAACFCQLCHEGCPGNHRRLLQHHWHQYLPAIHHKVAGDSQGQGINPHHVFNHVIRLGRGKPGRPAQRRKFLRSQPGFRANLLEAFLQGEIIESSHCHRIPFRGRLHPC